MGESLAVCDVCGRRAHGTGLLQPRDHRTVTAGDERAAVDHAGPGTTPANVPVTNARRRRRRR